MNTQLYQRPSGSYAAPVCEPSAGASSLGARSLGCTSAAWHDVISITPDLGSPSIVEMMVRQRAALFTARALPGLAAVIRIDRPPAGGGAVDVSSERAEGSRLGAVLASADARGTAPPLDAVLTIGDRLLAAIAALQRADNAPGAPGHGAIALDQIVVSGDGALTLTDYAFGPALAALRWPRPRLWQRFRIALPPSAGLARFDHRVDVTQAALVITALLAGRHFRADEYPRDLQALVDEGVRRSCADAPAADRAKLGAWLRAATELESRSAFGSAAAARAALRIAFGGRVTQPEPVRRWLREAAAPERETPQGVADAAKAGSEGGVEW